MPTIEQIEEHRRMLENALSTLTRQIGSIQIGTRDQFPFGWRKAAKGRTVWRILEEAINQNLEQHRESLGIASIECSDSEVSVFDCKVTFEGQTEALFMNIKSAVAGGRTNKDDISKAIGLMEFFRNDPERLLYIATFVLAFQEDMTVRLTGCRVMPIMWLPDIYVNPSNNGNLQSSKYKDLELATRRTNQQFLQELQLAMNVARRKKALAIGI